MFEIFKKLSKEQKDIYVDALNFVLHINKHIDEDKKEYMVSQLSDIGVDVEEAFSRKPLRPKEIILKLQGAIDMKFKRFIVREMILLAVSDNELSDIDIKHIYEIGLNAGVKQEKIGDLLLWAARGIEWQIEGVRILEED